MNTKKSIPEIVEGVERLANTLWPVFALQETLKELGDLENARLGAIKTVAQLKERIAALNTDAATAQSALDEAKVKAGGVVNESEKKAAEIVRQAMAGAEKCGVEARAQAADAIKKAAEMAAKIKASAEGEARAIVSAANAKRDDILNRANVMIDEGVKQSLEKLRIERQEEARAHAVKIGAAEAKLNDLNAKIEKAKAAAKAILG